LSLGISITAFRQPDSDFHSRHSGRALTTAAHAAELMTLSASPARSAASTPFAIALNGQGRPVPDIAKKLTINVGKRRQEELLSRLPTAG
jgi:hypothetical protein